MAQKAASKKGAGKQRTAQSTAQGTAQGAVEGLAEAKKQLPAGGPVSAVSAVLPEADARKPVSTPAAPNGAATSMKSTESGNAIGDAKVSGKGDGKAGQPKEKSKKTKLVRDSFTMPEAEYQVLSDMKKVCIKAGFEIKKSELLRIGVMLIRNMNTSQLQEALAGLTPLKAGRPKKEK